MPIVGKLELKSDVDVSAGAETSLSKLFSFAEQRKEFSVDADVTLGKTKLKLAIAKLGSLEATADLTKKKGEKTSLWMLMKSSDLNKKVKVSEAIKKGDVLAITVEAA